MASFLLNTTSAAYLMGIMTMEAAHAGDTSKWGSWLDLSIASTIGLSILILAGILLSLAFFRGRQTEKQALWWHLLFLGIFPILLLAFDNFSTLEYSKEVKFCGSCHKTMQSYVNDLRDPQSRSLAALHFRQRAAIGTECYACHANYGLHGTFTAKLKGLQEVVTYATGRYQLPIRMEHAFENAYCLKCHDGAMRFVAQTVHLTVLDQLRAEALKCTLCHRPAHAASVAQSTTGTGRAS